MVKEDEVSLYIPINDEYPSEIDFNEGKSTINTKLQYILSKIVMTDS